MSRASARPEGKGMITMTDRQTVAHYGQHIDNTMGGAYEGADLIDSAMRHEANRRAVIAGASAPLGGAAGAPADDPSPLGQGPDGQNRSAS